MFDLVRERLGARVGLVNLGASFFITMLTLIAEVAGVALAVQLVTDVNYLLWIPLVGLRGVARDLAGEVLDPWRRCSGSWAWRMIVVAVAVVQLAPALVARCGTRRRTRSVPSGEGTPTYFYYAIALFGAAMTPYEVFFFSSGAVEEKWTPADLVLNRANVFLGFPLGGLLSLALMAGAAIVFHPLGRRRRQPLAGRRCRPRSRSARSGSRSIIVGFVACTFGAALETALSCGYTMSQYFGWQWGKLVAPREAARFHLVVLVSIVVAVLVGLTAIDPIKVTEYSIVLSAAALPLTYFPILVVANDRTYMGDEVNGPVPERDRDVLHGDPRRRRARDDPADDRDEGGLVSATVGAGRQAVGRARAARPPDRRPRRPAGGQGRRPRARACPTSRTGCRVVTAILSGLGALAGHIGGDAGRWLAAVEAPARRASRPAAVAGRHRGS